MQSISDNINYKYEKVEYSEEDFVKEQVAYENQREGELNKQDGYNCDKCKNKGYISKAELLNGHFTEVSIKCSCMNIRKAIKSLMNCGLSYDALKNSKFENFEITEQWQKDYLEKVRQYLNSVLNDNKPYWIYVGGQTGAGKTMLLTAVFKNIIGKKYLTGQYLLWNNESKQLLNYGKRDSEKYNDRLYELTTCDILYIDDFFKLDGDNDYNNSCISLAYEIINNRYANKKLTIISSELTKEELNQKDGALFGRIFQMTNNGEYFIQIIGTEKDYRTKEMRTNND